LRVIDYPELTADQLGRIVDGGAFDEIERDGVDYYQWSTVGSEYAGKGWVSSRKRSTKGEGQGTGTH
jgi:hypothetical protein